MQTLLDLIFCFRTKKFIHFYKKQGVQDHKITILLIALDLIWLSQHHPGWMTILIGWTLDLDVVVSIRLAQIKDHFVLPMRVSVYICTNYQLTFKALFFVMHMVQCNIFGELNINFFWQRVFLRVPRSVWKPPKMGFCGLVLKSFTDSCQTFWATDLTYSVQRGKKSYCVWSSEGLNRSFEYFKYLLSIIMISKIMYWLKMFHFISSGLGAYDKAVIRDNETGEVIGKIHEFVCVTFCIHIL